MNIRFEVNDQVAVVTIARDEAMNAISRSMRQELKEYYKEVAENSNIRVLLLHGEGGRAFSTGADLKEPKRDDLGFAGEEFGGKSEHLLDGFPMEKPSICSIDGYALGGGLEIALMCDIRVASTNSTFGLPEVKIGSIPGSSGTQMLPRVVGLPQALRLVLTGERIDAAEALRIGLVQELTAPLETLDRGLEIAHQIASNAPLAVAAAKKLVSEAMDVPLSHGMALERYAFGLLRNTEDRNEGRVAFAEKRKPQFKGR